MERMHYNKAVSILDRYLQKKAVHNMKDLLHIMRGICNVPEWVEGDEQQDFANICSNFDKYVQDNKLTSIGRKQFEKWWDLHDMMTDLPEDPLPTSLEEAVDQLVESFNNADNSKETHDLKKENFRLRMENKELTEELKAANQKLENIKGIILWG